MRIFLTTMLLAVALAGCVGDSDTNSEPGPKNNSVIYAGEYDAYTVISPQARTIETRLIDDVRAGGEPVMAVASDGSIIVMTHPGWTHYHPTIADLDHSELVAPANGQSYLWRSTDDGATWTHVGLVGPNGPRSVGTGFSDPDLTVDAAGRIWYTDLIALAEQSVSYSDDNGATWTAGNVVAGAGAYVDRQWVGSAGDRVYLTANYFVDRSAGSSPDGARPFMTTNDDGLTWDTVGYAPCGGDFLSDPRDDVLVMACGLGVAISPDGASWEVLESPAGIHRGFFAHEPAIDTAGGIYLAANGQPLTPHDPNQLLLSYTPNRGEDWTVLDLSPAVEDFIGAQGTHVFAWVSAGSPGRAAVSWIGTADFTGAASDAVGASWYVYTALVSGMNTGQPAVEIVQVTDSPVHVGPMCSSGTTCQVQSIGVDPVAGTDSGDRRMGDFFETTIDHAGNLLYAVADTQTHPDDVVSHPRFIRMIEPGLFETEPPVGWPTQG